MKKESEQTKEFKKKFNESFTDQDIKEHIEKTKPFTELKEKNKSFEPLQEEINELKIENEKFFAKNNQLRSQLNNKLAESLEVAMLKKSEIEKLTAINEFLKKELNKYRIENEIILNNELVQVIEIKNLKDKINELKSILAKSQKFDNIQINELTEQHEKEIENLELLNFRYLTKTENQRKELKRINSGLSKKNKIKSHYITWKAVTTICIDVLT